MGDYGKWVGFVLRGCKGAAAGLVLSILIVGGMTDSTCFDDDDAYPTLSSRKNLIGRFLNENSNSHSFHKSRSGQFPSFPLCAAAAA